ncbi:MAG: DUF4058 family protein [Armatimonadota bacterium]|nr:DUF4058 family protein [Armatimonadota bacterium]
MIPIPLAGEDKPARLDLQAVVAQCYEDGAYELRVDYRSDPPPPPFSEEDLRWIDALLREKGKCGRAYVGFTGGSGGAVEIRDILSWSFTSFRTENSGDIDINGCVDDAYLLAVLFAFGSTGRRAAVSNTPIK